MLQILVVEILNSAVEAVVDRGGTERHPLAGMAKDMGSAAVHAEFRAARNRVAPDLVRSLALTINSCDELSRGSA